ncbi:MAG: ATP-binding protein [Proteobacteria bacterium]|nr:ATP-binding protein [Pseudomonadota bacterium]
MSAKHLDAAEVGLPVFALPDPSEGDESPGLFDLSSHQRARQAIEFGLSIADPGFNIFVLGEDRSGRMSSTLGYLEDHITARPAPSDWVYLNNFQRPNEPRPYQLPAGVGRRFRDRIATLTPALREALKTAFEAPELTQEITRLQEIFKKRVDSELETLRALVRSHGLDVRQMPQGLMLVVPGPDGEPIPPEKLSTEDQKRASAASEKIQDELTAFTARTQATQGEFAAEVEKIRRSVADQAMTPLLDRLEAEFRSHGNLARWLVGLRADILDQVAGIQAGEGDAQMQARLEERYAVNLLVDHGEDERPSVVLEPNPTYENLFGRIEYRQISGVLQTNYTLIRPGALHRANGGILVLRADSLAREGVAWRFLKDALRDRAIRIEELHRVNGVPIAGAPRPEPIPLDVKVVIVGAPQWYYSFFSIDPDFRAYFKVKADIDPDMEADECNLRVASALIRASTAEHAALSCDDDAVEYLLGQSARWAGHREKLSSSFELVQDAICEAGTRARGEARKSISRDDVKAALRERRERNARIEDRSQEHIEQGVLLIATEGRVIGQINALTVRDMGDYAFGTPARITARTFAGKHGVINIERATALGGPIQQKGVMVLEGLLNGRFAQRFPLSFSCSITFEQSYGGIEGDSASLAELAAILSALAQAPIRQDIAITGSLNQLGVAQTIGGINEKIEGFFRTCQTAGLSGEQGVIFPAANAPNLCLRDEVAEAIGKGAFHVWSVETADEAIELLMGMPAGAMDAEGGYPLETIYGRALKRLEEYDRILTARAAHRD